MRRFLTIVVSVVLMLVGSICGSLPANAWSGDLSTCTEYPQGWINSIKSDSRYNVNTSWVAFSMDPPYGRFNGPHVLVVVWGQAGAATITDQSHQIYIEGNGVDNLNNGLDVPATALLYRNVDGVLHETSIGGGYNYATFRNVNCIQDTHNVLYTQYNGASYVDIASTLQPFSGTIDCGGENPDAMIIEQDNNDGFATLTPVSLGVSTWEYDLSSEPYSIAVNCGGQWAYAFASVVASSTSGNWYCDPYGADQNYCVLG